MGYLTSVYITYTQIPKRLVMRNAILVRCHGETMEVLLLRTAVLAAAVGFCFLGRWAFLTPDRFLAKFVGGSGNAFSRLERATALSFGVMISFVGLYSVFGILIPAKVLEGSPFARIACGVLFAAISCRFLLKRRDSTVA